MTKALREAKTNTSWIDINEDYERRVLLFVEGLYASQEFTKDLDPFQKKLAYFGALSSLSQLVLKITSPGVPDIYRGTEFWDFSVADPDNRRPVDFALRNDALGKLQNGFQLNNLVENWSDGRLKMYVMWRLLNFRREHSDLFQQGEYIPLHVTGTRADHVIAFARRLHDKWCLVAVPRLYASLSQTGSLPVGQAVWNDTEIEIPPGAPVSWTHILTGHTVTAPLLASGIFRDLPLATLVR